MKRLAFIALIASGLAWGFGFPFGKFAMREMSAGQSVALRFAIAGIASLPFALGSKETRALFRSPIVLLTGVLYGVAFLVQFEGLAHISVTLAALLVGAMPALIAVAARFTGERIPKLSWVGVGAATLGAALIAGRPGDAGSPLGVVISLVALLIFLAWLMLLRRCPEGPTALALPSATIVVAAGVTVPAALLLYGLPQQAISPAAWAAVAGQGLLSTVFATAAWQYGLSRVGSATAGVFVNLEPLVGSAIGVMLFGDHLSLGLIVGGLLILAGSYAVVLGERAAPPSDLAHNPATPA